MAATDHAEDPEPEDPEPSEPHPAGLPFFRARPRPLDRWSRPDPHRKPGGAWPGRAWPALAHPPVDGPEGGLGDGLGSRPGNGPADGPDVIVTRVLSDRLVVRITQEPGGSFLDRMISLVEGAGRPARQRPGVVTAGTLRAQGVNFVVLATAASVVLALLNFLPALSLGTVADALS